MAKKGARDVIKLKSAESHSCYWTVRNKKTKTERLELNKYDPLLRKYVKFKESK
jgi:large subunit ribosomal protein L33